MDNEKLINYNNVDYKRLWSEQKLTTIKAGLHSNNVILYIYMIELKGHLL